MSIVEEERIVVLRKPVIIKEGEIEVKELRLREPTGEELEKAERENTITGQTITLISLIVKQPRSFIAKMSQRDLRECNDFLAQFNISGQPPESNG